MGLLSDIESKTGVVGQIHEINLLLNSNMADALQASQEAREAVNQMVSRIESDNLELRSEWEKQNNHYLNKISLLQESLQKTLYVTSNDAVEKLTAAQQDAVKAIFEQDQKTLIKFQEHLEQIKTMMTTASQSNTYLHLDTVNQLVKSKDITLEAIEQYRLQMEVTLSAVNKSVNKVNQTLKKLQVDMSSKLDEQSQKLQKSQNIWGFAVIAVIVLVGFFLREV